MSSIPSDFVTEILSRLPVKDLLRFRCVSKPWRFLIDSPEFVKLHVSFSQKTSTNRFLIFRLLEFMSLDFDSLETPTKLSQSLEIDHCLDEIVGSCNGLVALCNSRGKITLWNPSTRKIQKLVTPPIIAPKGFMETSIAHGFGYDPVTDDYKLVRIAHFCCDRDTFIAKGEVFSLKTNYWRKINCPFYFGYIAENGFLANNALHWVIPIPACDTKIVAFNLVKEEYHLVPQPECTYRCLMHLAMLGGCLSLASYHLNDGFDVWLMKEYGVKESWTKLFSLPLSLLKSVPFSVMIPLAYSTDGDKVLLNHHGYLLWYDLIRKKVEYLDMQGLLLLLDLMNVCVESLVALNESNGIDLKKKQVILENEKGTARSGIGSGTK